MRKLEAGGSGIQDHPLLLHSELKSSLGYKKTMPKATIRCLAFSFPKLYYCFQNRTLQKKIGTNRNLQETLRGLEEKENWAQLPTQSSQDTRTDHIVEDGSEDGYKGSKEEGKKR